MRISGHVSYEPYLPGTYGERAGLLLHDYLQSDQRFDDFLVTTRFTRSSTPEHDPDYVQNLLGFSYARMKAAGSDGCLMTEPQFATYLGLDLSEQPTERQRKMIQSELTDFSAYLTLNFTPFKAFLHRQMSRWSKQYEQFLKESAFHDVNIRFIELSRKIFRRLSSPTDRNNASLTYVAASTRLADGILQYLEEHHPAFLKQRRTQQYLQGVERVYSQKLESHDLDTATTMALDGQVTALEESLFKRYFLDTANYVTAGLLLDNIIKELNLNEHYETFVPTLLEESPRPIKRSVRPRNIWDNSRNQFQPPPEPPIA